MKIFFICGSLEPAHDGVGDYTRKLAEEVAMNGNSVAAISVNDQYILKETKEISSINNIHFNILRIPSILSAKERFTKAKFWINSFDPDWISVQFVPFSFQKKGLFFGLSNYLAKLSKGKYLHIMFHELWVGMDYNSSFKYKFWGKIQKSLTWSLIKRLRPNVIHTQTSIYQILLQKMGFNVIKLPLFSNIPVISKIEKDTGFVDFNLKKFRKLLFVVFGSIHPEVPVENFVQEIGLYCKEIGIKPALTIVGRNGKEQEHWVKVWKSAGIPVEVLGEQTQEYISKTLSSASIGLSTTPIALAEKSGTIAAMLEHGLNVICITYPWKVLKINVQPPDGVIEYSIGKLKESVNNLSNNDSNNSASTIASKFIEDLEAVM